jgi:hypothetical protein
MKLTGNKEGIAKFSEQNYEQAKASYARDLEAQKKAYNATYSYAVRNEKKFGSVKDAMAALPAFLDDGIVPEKLIDDEAGLKDFFGAALAFSLKRQLDENLRKSGKVIKEYESNKSDYLAGTKSLTFSDTGLSQTMDEAQRAFDAKAWDYSASKLESDTPEALAEKEVEEAREILNPSHANKYISNKDRIAELQAWIQEESTKEPEKNPLVRFGKSVVSFFSNNPRTIEEAQAELDKLTKENLGYEKKLESHKEKGLVDSGIDISSDRAKEIIDAATKEAVVQLTLGNPLPAGFSYKTYSVENQSGILYIQVLDKDGKEVGKPVNVAEYLAGAFNETIQYSRQGN